MHKLATTDDGCLVLTRTLTNIRYWLVCLLRAAQLPRRACDAVLLVHRCRPHRPAASAMLFCRGGQSIYSDVYQLHCSACLHRGIGAAFGSQHRRKTAHLKPQARSTSHDPSCMRVDSVFYICYQSFALLVCHGTEGESAAENLEQVHMPAHVRN